MLSSDIDGTVGKPRAELLIDSVLVRRLILNQHPDLADLPITPCESGWDNAVYRLGNHLCVRLPRRELAATLIKQEQTWLPNLAGRLPLPVPIPYRLGVPEPPDYPWNWSILPWIKGVTADREPPNHNQARRLGEFLRTLHTPAPSNAPFNPFRGVPLCERAYTLAERLQRLETKTDVITPALKALWELALSAPIDTQSTWIHGDLHPRNVLVANGEFTGIIDWGDLTSGDIATDLAAVWMLFGDVRTRQEVLLSYGNVSDATLKRTKGWAILFGVILLDTGLSEHSSDAVMGRIILERVTQAER